MSDSRAPSDMFRILFVVYCTTAGLLFLYAPWSPAWDTVVAAVPGGLGLLSKPLVRGALSGFGLVHFVWVLHELEAVLLAERRGESADG